MATTPKGIYYPNNYNEIADIPEDMKKMAESIDGVFEDTDSDLSDIKEEQTTQNNRLNSLEVDNTTNKSDILTNKQEINNIKTEQTEQNTNISTNATNIESLQAENEKLKSIVAQMPQVTGQGTSITLENTIEATFTKFEIEGNSTQDGTPNPNYEQPIESAGDNENLFDKDNEEQFLQNLTPDNNGLIVSAQTSTTSPNYIRTIIIPCKSDANYAITRFLGGKTFFIYESDEYPTLNKQTTLLKRNNDVGKASEIIKTSAIAKYLLVKIYNTYASEYYSYDELISSIKIEKGNKASVYSPYGMGSITEKIANKNLCAFTSNKLITTSHANINYNQNEESYVKIISTTVIDTNTTGLFRMLDLKNFAGKKLYIKARSRVVGTTNAFFFIRQAKFDYSVYSNMITSGNFTSEKLIEYQVANTITEDNRYLFLMMYGRRETTGAIGDYIEYWLSIATENVDYVPHQEQDYSIFVQKPFRSIGDVRDCFVKKNSSWYERHYIGEVVFDGSEDEEWRFNATSTTPSNRTVIITNNNLNSKYNVNADYVSNMFIKNSTSSNKFVLSAGLYLSLDDALTGITSNDDNNVKLTKMLTYLSTHNVVVQYELAEPQDLPCTSEQIEALENLPSTYQDFTYVVSEDETPAYLEVSGIYDMNKLITRVEVIESES